MGWTRPVVISAIAGAIAAAVFVASCTQQASVGTTAASAEDPIAHGRRLAWSSGCNDCHTPGSMYGVPDTTRLLSGSELGWAGPWGVSYARNLTPDAETGIGSWTEEEIVTAITAGHRPDGTPLLPPMPWPSFAAGLTPEEAHAIAAYLKTIPPVKHKLPDAVAAGKAMQGAAVAFPPPPAWDAQNLPPPGAGAPAGGPAGTDPATKR